MGGLSTGPIALSFCATSGLICAEAMPAPASNAIPTVLASIRASSTLDELERKAVALAYRLVLRAILVLQPVGRRQRPDALGMVLRVLRVGVDFRSRRQPEACALDQRDRIVLAHVARFHLRFLTLVRAPAMVDDAEHAAGLERAMEGAQRSFGLAALHPVAQVAEGDDEIGAAGRRDLVAVGVELRHHHLPVELRLLLEARKEPRVILQVLRCRELVPV